MNTVIIPKQAVSQLKKAIDNLKLPEAMEMCTNEAQTRKFLIEPFFQTLNYQSTDLIPEYNADFGDRISNKVDYAIRINPKKKEYILVEAKKHNTKLSDKEAGQLNGYFGVTKNSKIAVLTNGIEYKFFSDVCEPNIIDSKPFFTFHLINYSESDLEGLIKFDKRFINVPEIIKAAQTTVFNQSFETAFFNELVAPSKDLLKLIHKNMTFQSKFNEDSQKNMIGQINSTFLRTMYDRKVVLEASSNSQGVITTESEIQAYHTIRTLLIQNKKIPRERLGFKDYKGFFTIGVDDNSKKVICKLMFNGAVLKIAISDKEYTLDHVDDLLKYKNELTNRTMQLLEA
jgi:hypothetical protein